jgi:hypothetical protein
VLWELASQRYKEACQIYAKERALMQGELYIDRKEQAVNGIVEQLKAAMQGIPTAQIHTAKELRKEDEIRSELENTGQFDEIRKAALNHGLAKSMELTDEFENFEA